jgi:hypothetical protein
MCDTAARPILSRITMEPAEIVAAAWKLAETKPTKQASRRVSIATKKLTMRTPARDESAVIRRWMREVQQIDPIGKHVVTAVCELGKSKILAQRGEAHAALLATVLALAQPLPCDQE